MMNIIVANQIIHRIRNESLDYELFREMKISSKLIEDVLSEDDNPYNKSNYYDSYDMLTLYSLVYNYDTLNFKKINKRNSDLILRSLVYDETFRELKKYYQSTFKDIETFPVLQTSDEEANVTFTDTWYAPRSYGGDRRHEGTDILDKDNARGRLKIVSMTDGVVEKKGWLEMGGYRIGIRSESGTYFYYAHLDSYNDDIKVGDRISAGDFLGYMGDSGYGPEGTKGEFDVHLHLGIYIDSKIGEIAVNPYYILDYLQNKALSQVTGQNIEIR
ncbi:MAG: peptidoglycan DD-metalloendopeptidase family protein [Clostridiales bacterium]|nr:peptidoglycan DD-metalloendopeptidase family protein [Clostridiales bacterium]